jgi:hypothetical protein
LEDLAIQVAPPADIMKNIRTNTRYRRDSFYPSPDAELYIAGKLAGLENVMKMEPPGYYHVLHIQSDKILQRERFYSCRNDMPYMSVRKYRSLGGEIAKCPSIGERLMA